MTTVTLVGLSASILTTMALVPQLIKIIQTKKVENISILWVIILFFGLCSWIYYGVLKNDTIILVSNIISAAINGAIGFFALKYKDNSN